MGKDIYNDLDEWLEVGRTHHNICVMITICIHCGKIINVQNGQGVAGVSSGICPACRDKQKDIIAQFREGM